MITNLTNKYKDRSPKETVKIITDFFTNKGYKVIIKTNEQTESGSWWCRICLSFNDFIFLGANGKGTSEIFSLASGHAELYERYCNGINTYLTPFIPSQKIKELKYKEKGYYICPEEKELTINEVFNNSPKMKQFFNYLDTNTNDIRHFIKNCFNNKFIGVPYYGLNINDTKYMIPELSIVAIGSSGMAAGNTLEEAIVQGMSELFEHFVHDKMYAPLDKYYELNLDIIDMPEKNREMLNNILSNNYDIKIFDFSYNFNLPVLGILVIDLNNQTCYLNLGSAPVFDIALERCITEVYQGYKTLRNDVKNFMIPSRILNLQEIAAQEAFSISFHKTYAEEMFYNIEIKDKYNTEIFLTHNDYSNEQLKDFYINIINQLKWNVYYRDASLCEDIYAIHLIIDNFMMYDSKIKLAGSKFSDNQKKHILKFMEQYNTFMQNYLNGKFNETEYNNIIDILYNFIFSSDIDYLYYIGCLPIYDFFELYSRSTTPSFGLVPLLQKEVFYTQFNSILQYIKSDVPYAYAEIMKYKTLYAYTQSNKYNLSELKQIMNFYHLSFTEEEYNNIINKKYFLKKALFENIYKVYKSDSYQNYLKTYI